MFNNIKSKLIQFKYIRKNSQLKLSSYVWHQVDGTLTQEPSIGNVSANLAEFETLFFSSMINFYYVQRIWKIVGLSRPFWKGSFKNPIGDAISKSVHTLDKRVGEPCI